MGRKSKEDDRIEKIIRGLLRLPENRRCINCNSLGPQYVCTTFWTFVCTNCSGLHREFTHRVKSVSMAKFSADEISALQSGGNEQARRIYLRTWDPVHDGFPDSCNLSLIRDFIKRVYVEKRYTGDGPASHNRFPRSKLIDRNDSYEARSRSSSSERSSCSERYVDRNDRHPSDEGRSYIRENYKLGGSMREPFRDKRPVDRLHVDSTVLRRSATQMFTTADLPRERHSPRNSPAFQRNRGLHSTPARSPIFGDNFLNLQIRDQVKSGDDKKTDSAKVYKIAPPSPSSKPVNSEAANTTKKSSDVDSSTEAPTKQELKNESKEPAMGDLLSQDGDVLASPNPSEEMKVFAVPPKDTLEFLLFELGNPASRASDDKSGPSTVGNNDQLATDKAPLTTSSNAEACSHFIPSWPSEDIKAPLSNNCLASHDTDGAPVTTTSDAEAGSPHFFPSWPSDDIKASSSNNCVASHDTDRAPVSTPSNAEACSLHFSPSWPSDDIKAPSSNNSVVSHEPSTRPNPVLPNTDGAEVKQMDPHYFERGAPYGSCANRLADFPCRGGGHTMSFDAMALKYPANTDSSNGLSAHGEGTRPRPVGDFMDTNFHSSTPLILPSRPPQHTTLPSSYPSDGCLNFQSESSSRVHHLTEQAQGANSDGHRIPSPAQAVRKELPEDIFTSLYTLGPTENGHGWQAFPNYGMGFNMQYHNATAQGPPAALCHAPKSRNPFDIEDEVSQQGHGAMLPPRGSTTQGSLAATQGISSLSNASNSPAPGDSYMGQNLFNNKNMGSTREGRFVSDGGMDMFGSGFNQGRQVGYGYCSAPAGPSGGGNPFG